ncbi:hypothetical protein R69927_07336 [Paraburkholderia domus]|jgi:hypothetical protein|uniref:hypothetical protein n=1 Tax=Paraburkholderia domus TaxID=2793075 RepID=UPI001B149D44|nr:hypothetical protein [Paraburkholderia domus]CAE6857424.1 hypothetical protein R70006_07898 [Paraburkholderia domus]CAE6899567.1 hypothetical protein R69749_08069 [Paraburkholderia domus]CAE6934218.1 hypothetical protein R69927_07336 [Paraburkholderia domus]CAE6966763.1 hypothetical protein R70199_07777 [Paraburkholderia domus]
MRTASSNDPLPTAIPPARLLLQPEPPRLAPGIVHSNFSVQGDARQSFLAWQERMSPVYDIQPSSKQAEDRFDASLSRYTIDNLSFFDFHTGPNVAVRSLGRVSTESVRDLTFSVFLEGPPGQLLGGKTPPDASRIPQVPSILALDMDQPCTIRSFHGRLLLLFVPRALVEKSFPDAASLHGRRIHATTPLTRLQLVASFSGSSPFFCKPCRGRFRRGRPGQVRVQISGRVNDGKPMLAGHSNEI